MATVSAWRGPSLRLVPAVHRLVFYKGDDCMFIDGEYIVRNTPGRILRLLLETYRNEGRTQFSNRELRLDRRLGLPAVRSNLESRLILLRKRLAERCPHFIALVPVARGRFQMVINESFELEERP